MLAIRVTLGAPTTGGLCAHLDSIICLLAGPASSQLFRRHSIGVCGWERPGEGKGSVPQSSNWHQERPMYQTSDLLILSLPPLPTTHPYPLRDICGKSPTGGSSDRALTLLDLHDDLHGAREAHTSLPVLQSLQAPIGCSCSKSPEQLGGERGCPCYPEAVAAP